MKIDHSLWKIRRNKMSKKKLLKESTIRRFGGLAGIKPAATSNFLNEFGDPVYMREEEDELEVEEPVGGEELEIEDEVEIEEPAEGGDAEGLVVSLLDKVKEWASEQGVEMDVEEDGEGGEEVDMEMDMELGGEEEEVELEMGEEETLEEMINSVLSEEEEELEEKKEWGAKSGDVDQTHDEETGDKDSKIGTTKKGDPTRSVRGRDGQKLKADKWLGDRGKQSESVQIVDDEKVIQEVTKRVKQRLARIAKSQRRRK